MLQIILTQSWLNFTFWYFTAINKKFNVFSKRLRHKQRALVHKLLNTGVIYNDLYGICVPKATTKKSSIAGYSIFPDFDFHCAVIIAYIFSRQSPRYSTIWCSLSLCLFRSVFLEWWEMGKRNRIQSILFSWVLLETTILILEKRNVFMTLCRRNTTGEYLLNVNTQER